MSGHSKWAKIKHKKGLNDAKKGKIFSQYGQQIAIAARDGGPDLNANFTLRLLVDKAKADSMPSDNIKRAIDRGAGKGSEALVIEYGMYEGYASGGVSVIVEVLTDNKNRAIAEVRSVFSDRGGSIGDSGVVSWNFTQVGVVKIRPAKLKPSEKYGHEDDIVFVDSEEVMLELMDLEGVLDIEEYEENGSDNARDDGKYMALTVDNKSLGRIRDQVNEMGYIVVSAELMWKANIPKEVDANVLEKIENFIEAMDEIEDVQSIWTDVDHLI